VLHASIPPDLASRLGALVRDHGPTFCARARFREGDECHRELVHEAPDVQLWLLSWLPEQITPIHDHGGAVTVTTVLAGALLEERFELVAGGVRPTWRARRVAGDLDPIDAAAIHRVQPVGATVTLHLYAPSCVDGQIYQVAA
jgi:predicted metal-dependent enzyme (double-stranded beta helix superfamily)